LRINVALSAETNTMNTLEKIERMARKVETLRAFVTAHCTESETVCVHQLDGDQNPPSITLYDRADAIARFGHAGWFRFESQGAYHWRRIIDGVRVDIYRAESIVQKETSELEPVPESVALATEAAQ
jgi:hypothetical protein